LQVTPCWNATALLLVIAVAVKVSPGAGQAVRVGRLALVCPFRPKFHEI